MELTSRSLLCTASAVTSFSDQSAHERRHAGDRNALW
jgi:hypothetical protein